MQLLEGWHAGSAGDTFLAAHRLQAESAVEDVQVVLRRQGAERIHDRDRDATAVKTLLVQR
jgi:hypothetical protein